MIHMNRLAGAAIAAVLLSTPLFAASHAADEKVIWSMEDNYWQYVQANDLEQYRTLWHADFLGWPLSSPEPVHKDQITGWIAAHTSKGEALKSYEVERIAIQVSGDCVTAAYRIHMNWVGKDGVDQPSTIRVVHSWLHDAAGKWQIISGMAAAVNAQGH